MARSQKFFRYVWRINAVLILVTAATALFAIGALLVQELAIKSVNGRQSDVDVPVGHSDADTQLSLGRASLVEGTNVMRAQLTSGRKGMKFGSGDSQEVRNILFIEPGEKAARWLLADNDHIIDDTVEVTEDNATRHTIATAVLVKPQSNGEAAEMGRLLLFDLAGKKIVEVADAVQEIQVASVSEGDLTILFKRERKLALAVLDPATFAKRREQPIDVPQLK